MYLPLQLVSMLPAFCEKNNERTLLTIPPLHRYSPFWGWTRYSHQSRWQWKRSRGFLRYKRRNRFIYASPSWLWTVKFKKKMKYKRDCVLQLHFFKYIYIGLVKLHFYAMERQFLYLTFSFYWSWDSLLSGFCIFP